MRITKEQYAALDELGIPADSIGEDDISDAGRIFATTKHGSEVLIDLDGSYETDEDPAVIAAAALSRRGLLDAAAEGQQLGTCDED